MERCPQIALTAIFDAAIERSALDSPFVIIDRPVELPVLDHAAVPHLTAEGTAGDGGTLVVYYISVEGAARDDGGVC